MMRRGGFGIKGRSAYEKLIIAKVELVSSRQDLHGSSFLRERDGFRVAVGSDRRTKLKNIRSWCLLFGLA